MVKTVATLVTATQSHALLRFSRQEVSSAPASRVRTYSRSSSTGVSRLSLVARSSLQTMPVEMVSPNRSAASDWIGRLPSRYAPASRLRTACNRGPKAPRGTPAESWPQVFVPQFGHINRCRRKSATWSVPDFSLTWGVNGCATSTSNSGDPRRGCPRGVDRQRCLIRIGNTDEVTVLRQPNHARG